MASTRPSKPAARHTYRAHNPVRLTEPCKFFAVKHIACLANAVDMRERLLMLVVQLFHVKTTSGCQDFYGRGRYPDRSDGSVW